jgi:hypothetical protein
MTPYVPPFTREQAEQGYVVEKLALEKLGSRYGVSKDRAQKALQHYGIPRRPSVASSNKRKYFPTPGIDAAIREAYRLRNQFKNTRALVNAGARVGWSREAMIRRAAELGIAKTREKPWSRTEEDILEQWCSHSAWTIYNRLQEAGFHRTLVGIGTKMKRLKVRRSLDTFSPHQLAHYLGATENRIFAWIKAGWLKAEDRGFASEKKTYWVIQPADLRKFILHHPDEIVLARIDPAMQLWFLDLVSGGKLCEDFRREVAA